MTNVYVGGVVTPLASGGISSGVYPTGAEGLSCSNNDSCIAVTGKPKCTGKDGTTRPTDEAECVYCPGSDGQCTQVLPPPCTPSIKSDCVYGDETACKDIQYCDIPTKCVKLGAGGACLPEWADILPTFYCKSKEDCPASGMSCPDTKPSIACIGVAVPTDSSDNSTGNLGYCGCAAAT